METQKFSIRISASAKKVWAILWDDETYRQWTAAFCEGSMVETDWKVGSKILFLDGKGSGMVSKIEEMIPHRYMSFKHLGEVKDGVKTLRANELNSGLAVLKTTR